MHKDSRNTAATKWTKCFVYTRWNTFAGEVDGRGGRGAGAWGAQFHGPFGLAALGVNNNHKDVTITHWNRSEWTAMCDVNVWRVPTERENYGESKECWTIVKLVFRLRLFYGLFSTQCSTFVWRGNGNGNGLPSRKLFSVTIFTV